MQANCSLIIMITAVLLALTESARIEACKAAAHHSHYRQTYKQQVQQCYRRRRDDDEHYHDDEDKDKVLATNGTLILSGEQWAKKLSCNYGANQELKRRENRKTKFKWPIVGSLWYKISNKCDRDPNAWRYKYGDELRLVFQPLVKDTSIDERLANVLYIAMFDNVVDTSYVTFNSGDPIRDVDNEQLRVVGSQVNDTKCTEELAIMSGLYDDMLDTLKRFKSANKTARAKQSLEERHIRLARVLDSFGRYESGSLHGKNWLAGHYEECIGSQLASNGELGDTMIQMRYCWANMDIQRHLHPLLKERKRFKQETAIPIMNVAVCLPRSCHSKHFHDARSRRIVQRFIDSQLRLPDSIYLDESLQLDSVFCLVDDDSEWARIPVSGKLCLLLFSLWTALCLIATVANRCQESPRPRKSQYKPNQMSSWPKRVSNSLDLVQSWRDLFSDKRPVDSSNMALIDVDVLNPVKLAACTFCVISHTGLLLAAVAAGFGDTVVVVGTGRLLMGALLSSGVIDGFFTISGILVTYSSLSKLSKSHRNRKIIIISEPGNQVALGVSSLKENMAPPRIKYLAHSAVPKRPSTQFLRNWFNLALNRYMRIVPLYALLFWFRRDVLNYLGSGPMWDYGLNRNTTSGACFQEPWYTPFTFISAFRPVAAQCFPTSWSISNDIFFALFTPPITLMFHYKPKLATVITCSLILASTLAAIEALINSNPALVWEFLEFTPFGLIMQYKELSSIYAWPIYRVSAFLVGSLAGYGLFNYGHNNTQDQALSPKWPQWFSGPLTLLSCLYFIAHHLLAITFNDLKQSTWPLMRLFVFFNFNLDRVIWSMASSVLFLQMVTTWRHSSLMQNFSSQLWRTLAKLSYSVIFVHWILIVTYAGTVLRPPLFTLANIFSTAALIFSSSFIIGAILHIVFENPVNKLIKREIFAHFMS